jgi:hypothetical protein
MSNKRITDLTELTTPTTDDVFPVVDIATNTTTKVQLANLPVQTAVTTALATKQATLVSGTNIKTVNSNSLLGAGDVAVQETLVSGTNIKTLNSVSLLGAGNIVLAATPSGVAGAIQFSNGSAFASDAANLFWDDTNNRLGVGLNNPTATTQIKGASTGSGTNSFIVQDSAGTNLMSVRDDGILSLFTSSKTGQLDIQGGANSGIYSKAYSSQSDNIIRYKDYNGNQAMMLTMTGSGTGSLTVNNGITSLGATIGIKGSGSTSATTALLVQNSAGVERLRVYDNGNFFVGSSFSKIEINPNDSNYYSSQDLHYFQGGGSGYFGAAIRCGSAASVGMQIGNTIFPAAASAILDLVSTQKGFLPPRMTTTQKNAIASPASGLILYDSTTNKLQCYNGSTWNDLF